MASNEQAVMTVSFWPLWQLLLSIPLPLCVYKYGRGGRSSGCANSFSDALHSAHSRPAFCGHRESGRVGLVVRRATLARVYGRLGFWGAYSRLLAPSARPALIHADPVPRRRRRSRDCTAYICLHRLCMTTSNIHIRCLV
jgi:hypothetical protein